MGPEVRERLVTAPTGATIYRCAPCQHGRHAQCHGKGACNCRTCRAAEIINTAGHRLKASNSPALLRESLDECLALLGQRHARERQVTSHPAQIRRCSECGDRMLNLPAGRHRQTCSWRCRKAKQRRLAKALTAGTDK